MKQLLILVLLCPLFAAAQDEDNHRFENDTLYTSCGFKIYPGQTLHIGKRPNDFTGFRYISKISNQPTSLEDRSVQVTELSGYGYSPTGSARIDVKAAITYRDGSKGVVTFTLAFDLAIGTRLPGTYRELVLPEPYNITVAQALAMHKPALQNDTLYTSSGYKIYLGQFLQIGRATGKRGSFRYLTFLKPVDPGMVEDNQLRVEEIKDLTFSVLGNAYINITGSLFVNNKEGRELQVHLAFDHAIENVKGIPGELVVPEAYRGILKINAEQELKRVKNLYLDEVISKEEYEAAEKFLLGR